ncbi:MAG: hypothetical protein CVT63_01580 [Candidatus Anoxymicrobium japonicum]|uniref:Uncharacterized protein n=1 Tax=Candidatus Anoxymicrobium japonicum TaxID=2013648 RepID=A0A2N3G7M8_9ACTN|nr:MAG: hypothetical protein CVT63_01580 [Candidatus Anoxymicrobium japonicum]
MFKYSKVKTTQKARYQRIISHSTTHRFLRGAYLLTGEEGKTWDAREIDWSLQDFLKLFLSLSPEQQSQVMAFTGFIAGKDSLKSV